MAHTIFLNHFSTIKDKKQVNFKFNFNSFDIKQNFVELDFNICSVVDIKKVIIKKCWIAKFIYLTQKLL